PRATRQDERGPALLLRVADRRDGPRRHGAVRALPVLGLRAAEGRTRARQQTRARRKPPRPPRQAALVGLDRRARRDPSRECLLSDDVVLLLLRVPGARAGGAARFRTGSPVGAPLGPSPP